MAKPLMAALMKKKSSTFCSPTVSKNQTLNTPMLMSVRMIYKYNRLIAIFCIKPKLLFNKFAHTRFEPAGLTGNPDIPIAKSVIDYVFRWLGLKFLNQDTATTFVAAPASAAEVATGTIGEMEEAELARVAVLRTDNRDDS